MLQHAKFTIEFAFFLKAMLHFFCLNKSRNRNTLKYENKNQKRLVESSHVKKDKIAEHKREYLRIAST